MTSQGIFQLSLQCLLWWNTFPQSNLNPYFLLVQLRHSKKRRWAFCNLNYGLINFCKAHNAPLLFSPLLNNFVYVQWGTWTHYWQPSRHRHIHLSVNFAPIHITWRWNIGRGCSSTHYCCCLQLQDLFYYSSDSHLQYVSINHLRSIDHDDDFTDWAVNLDYRDPLSHGTS